MSNISMVMVDDGQCTLTHQGSKAVAAPSRALEYGGTGDAFSGTDLLAPALGGCMTTSLQTVALRENLPLDQFQLNLAKEIPPAPSSSLPCQCRSLASKIYQRICKQRLPQLPVNDRFAGACRAVSRFPPAFQNQGRQAINALDRTSESSSPPHDHPQPNPLHHRRVVGRGGVSGACCQPPPFCK